MFWTDYGNNPTIERATLAGQERTPIISSNTTLKYPNDVIVDYSSNRIYWVDAGLDVVGTADMQGHYINISEPIKSSHLYAMALYDNKLYISNVETNAKSIIVIDKESLKESKIFTSSVIESRDILGMAMLHESRQPPGKPEKLSHLIHSIHFSVSDYMYNSSCSYLARFLDIIDQNYSLVFNTQFHDRVFSL